MFVKEIFGQRLQLLRKERNENQEALAALIGVSKAQVSEMERGNNGTSLERLVLLCEHYNVSADYLLGLTEERKSLTISGDLRGQSPVTACGGDSPFQKGP